MSFERGNLGFSMAIPFSKASSHCGPTLAYTIEKDQTVLVSSLFFKVITVDNYSFFEKGDRKGKSNLLQKHFWTKTYLSLSANSGKFSSMLNEQYL